MGLFGGKKKTQQELLDEGKRLYEAGEYKKALIQLLKADSARGGERDYWIGRCYLATGNQRDAKRHLNMAVRDGSREAEQLLAGQAGEKEPVAPVKEPAPPAEKPAPVPKEEKPAVPIEEPSPPEQEPASASKKEKPADFASGKKPAPVTKPVPKEEKSAVSAKEPAPPVKKPEPVPVPKEEKPAVPVTQKPASGNKSGKKAAVEEKPEKHAPSPRKLWVTGYVLFQRGMYENALPLIEQAAEMGEVEAMHLAGLMYYDGKGTAEDHVRAFRMLRKAADLGYPPSLYNCGVMYEEGDGVRKDLSAAWACYKMAADQNYPDALFNCGVCCFNGFGIPASRIRAKEWFQKAAAQTENERVREEARKILRERF